MDEAVLNFSLNDCQPISIVESEGFTELLQVLQPSYVLPTTKVCTENDEKIVYNDFLLKSGFIFRLSKKGLPKNMERNGAE